MIKTLLALSAAAVLNASAAAAAEPIRIPVHDLKLDTAAGAAALDLRIREAARERCGAAAPIRLVDTHCVVAFRREVLAQLPRQERSDFARARRVDRF